MAETATAPTNKLVAFRGRARKEFTRAYKHGLISDAAMRKVSKKKFAKTASHNPPKPTYAEEAESSLLEQASRPVAAAANRLRRYLRSDKPAATSATLGVRG